MNKPDTWSRSPALMFVILFSICIPVLHAQDPAKVSPANYTITWENVVTRVLLQRMRPGEHDQVHDHPIMATYHITDGLLLLHLANGSTSQREFKAGTASWLDSQKDVATENIGSAEMQMLAIEIKKRSLNPDWRLDSRDPVRVNPDIYKVLLENRRIRVFIATLPPGITDKLSAWPGLLMYPLTDGKLEITIGKTTTPIPCTAHKPWWQAFKRQTIRNAGENELKLLLVEVK